MAKIDTVLRIAKHYIDSIEDHGHNRHLVSAVITDSCGKIISKASNSYNKTHPLQAKHACKTSKPDKIYLHAEIAALVKCHKMPHTLYVFRFLRDGNMALAKPCPVCDLALREAGVKKVIYTSDSGLVEYVIA